MRSASKLMTALLASLLPMQLVMAEDLLTVYQLAVSSDPILRGADAERRARLENEPQAMAELLPRVDLFGDTNYLNFKNSDGYNTNNLTISARQPIFRLDRMKRLARSKFEVAEAEYQYDSVEQELIIRTADAYFGLLDTEVEVAFTIADKKAIGRQLEQAQRRFEVGLVTITDVYEAQARYDRAIANEILAVNERADAQEALRQLTGQAIPSVFFLSQDLPLVTAEPHDVEVWVEEARRNNPTVLAARANVDAAGEEIEVQRAANYPSVDAVASYINDNSNAPLARDLDGGVIGLELSLNLFAGGGIASRTRQAADLRERSLEGMERSIRSAERQTRDAFRNLDATISFVNAVDQTVISSRSAAEATQAGFDVGTRTIVDVLDAERDLLLAQRDYEIARNAHVLSRLELKQAAGNLSGEDLALLNRYLTPQPYEWLMPDPSAGLNPLGVMPEEPETIQQPPGN